MVVVKWSVCLPSSPTYNLSSNRAEAYIFYLKFVFENKQKEAEFVN